MSCGVSPKSCCPTHHNQRKRTECPDTDAVQHVCHRQVLAKLGDPFQRQPRYKPEIAERECPGVRL